MHHYFDYLADPVTGAPQIGIIARFFIGSIEQNAFADANGTSLITAQSDANGRFDCWIAEGVYDVIYYDGTTPILNRPQYQAMSPDQIDDAKDRANHVGTQSAATITITQDGTASLTRTVESKVNERYSLTDKGDMADAAIALNRVATDKSSGGKVHVPQGHWHFSNGFTFSGQRLRLEGDGANLSVFEFEPSLSGKAAIEYNNTSPGGLYQGVVSGFGFFSGNSVGKTAIRLINHANVEVSHIGIPENSWPGSNSVGLHVQGRQALHFHNSEISCSRPVLISKNTLWPTLNTDHFKIDHVELTTTQNDGKVIEIENGVMITTCTFKNMALCKGKYGFYWNDNSSLGASYGLVIEKMRREQSTDPDGHSIYLATSNQVLQNLVIRDCYLDLEQNGIFLRGARRVLIENTLFAMGPTKTAIDMEFQPGSSLLLVNCTFDGAAMAFTNARCVRRIDSGRGLTEEWVYDADSSAGSILSDANHGGVPKSLGINEAVPISDQTSIGHILISTSEDLLAMFGLHGPSHKVSEFINASGLFSSIKDNSGTINIYWDASNARYMLQNRRPEPISVSIFMIGANL